MDASYSYGSAVEGLSMNLHVVGSIPLAAIFLFPPCSIPCVVLHLCSPSLWCRIGNRLPWEFGHPCQVHLRMGGFRPGRHWGKAHAISIAVTDNCSSYCFWGRPPRTKWPNTWIWLEVMRIWSMAVFLLKAFVCWSFWLHDCEAPSIPYSQQLIETRAFCRGVAVQCNSGLGRESTILKPESHCTAALL